MNKSLNYEGAAGTSGDYSGATASMKQLGKDPEKSLLSDLRVATDKFFMGNENFLPDIKDVCSNHLIYL